MSLADNYCEKCIHFEICQMTGCQDRKDLEALLKLAEKIGEENDKSRVRRFY